MKVTKGQQVSIVAFGDCESPGERQTISFIIPLFNHLAHTQAMLASLRATIPAGLAHEVILIDDFSTDGTRDWLATLSDPHIKTLRNPHNLGFAKTNNRAASVATGDVLALLNNDLLFAPGWLEPMLHALQSPTLNAGMVGNAQYRVADAKLDHAGVGSTPMPSVTTFKPWPTMRLRKPRRLPLPVLACCYARPTLMRRAALPSSLSTAAKTSTCVLSCAPLARPLSWPTPAVSATM